MVSFYAKYLKKPALGRSGRLPLVAVMLCALLAMACGAAGQSKGGDYATSPAEPGAYPQSAGAVDGDYDDSEAEMMEGTVSADYRSEPSPAPARATTRDIAKKVEISGGSSGAPPPAPPPPPQQQPARAKSKPTEESPTSATAASSTDRRKVTPLLVYKAHLNVAVFETEKSIDKVERLAREAGGYLVRRDDTVIVVRIPTKKYHDALETIAKIGDVIHREVSVQDVTEQFYDMQTRLKNLRAVRDRFEQLLGKAKNVEEALAVQRELERVTTEMERLEGRLKVLRELIAFSTITVEFAPRSSDKIDPKFRLPFGWLSSLGLSRLLEL